MNLKEKKTKFDFAIYIILMIVLLLFLGLLGSSGRTSELLLTYVNPLYIFVVFLFSCTYYWLKVTLNLENISNTRYIYLYVFIFTIFSILNVVLWFNFVYGVVCYVFNFSDLYYMINNIN